MYRGFAIDLDTVLAVRINLTDDAAVELCAIFEGLPEIITLASTEDGGIFDAFEAKKRTLITRKVEK